jgi:hypothetical protein
MKHLLRWSWLTGICLATLILPSTASSWGSATHAYIMKQLARNQAAPLAIYGAMAPDIFNVIVDSEDYGFLGKETHRHFMKVYFPSLREKMGSFALGFMSHNEVWGADYTAHIRYWRTRTGYVAAKSIFLGKKIQPALQAFLEEVGIPNASAWANFAAPLLSHPLLETAIDLLVQQELDPFIGTDVIAASQERPQSVPGILVKAYRKDLMKELGFTAQQAEDLIRDTEAEFRAMMMDYGEIISWERTPAVEELARQGALLAQRYFKSASGYDIEVPPAMLADFLEAATGEAEKDYREVLQSTIDRLTPFYENRPLH